MTIAVAAERQPEYSWTEVEPPFPQHGEDEQIARFQSLLAKMGNQNKRPVIYTSLPACNSES